ncbi:hypothetical protein YC2023_057440 [Brassica napus]
MLQDMKCQEQRKKMKTLARGRRQRRRRRKGISRRKMQSVQLVSVISWCELLWIKETCKIWCGVHKIMKNHRLKCEESDIFVVLAGYSSTAVYNEWKLSKSQGMYVIFAKNDQNSGLVSNCLLVSLFVEGRCSCGFRMFGRMKIGGTYEFQAVQILLKLSRFKFEVKLQRRMVHDEFLQVLEQDRFEECVESSRKKQKQEHVMFPEECVKRKDKKSKSNVSICWIEFLVGSKLIAWEKYEWKRQLVIEGVYKFKSVQDVLGHWCLCSVF